MIRTIDGQGWFCCPVCGKKLFPVAPGAVCRGLWAKCRGRRPDGRKCAWEGEVRIGQGRPA